MFSCDCPWPKKISLPTKKLGDPNEPGATALLVFPISFFLTSSCSASCALYSCLVLIPRSASAADMLPVAL
jgi:hypothetical protein